MQDIVKIGDELVKISNIKNLKYPFREDYINTVMNKWNKRQGKYLIHLLDLPDSCIVRFNSKGRRILKKAYYYLKNKYGLDVIHRKYKVNFYSLHYVLNKNQKGLGIKTLKDYIKFFNKIKLDFNIDKFEKNITLIHSTGKFGFIKVNGLPLDLTNKNWAYLFGIILDCHIKQFKIKIENKEFSNKIIEIMDNIGIKYNFHNDNLFDIIQGPSIVSKILSISGIEINKRQILANNVFPSWIYKNCNKEYHAILLSKILDTEGCSPMRNSMIRIAQSNFLDITNDEKKFIFESCKKTRILPSGAKSDILLFSKLNEDLKEKVISNPPPILISIQLLLRKYKINSILYPFNVYISSNNLASSSWHLNIQDFESIKRFYNLCGEYISIPYKKQRIEVYIRKKSL